jgi:transposase InsO family protein
MQQIYLESFFKGGYRKFMNYISNIAHMSEHDRKIIYHRVRVLEFFEEFGLLATKKAFNIGRSTIFLWKQKLKHDANKLSSLASLSKKPKSFRVSMIDPLVIEFIRQYRTIHPGVDKYTIKPVLDAYCKSLSIGSVSQSSIGRIIRVLNTKNLIPKRYSKIYLHGRLSTIQERTDKTYQKKLRRKTYQPKDPGDLVQIDSITIFCDGVKRYIITAIDLATRFSFAHSYKQLSSLTATDFMKKLESVAPFIIKRIQTDNGLEFHKYFRDYIKKKNIVHFFNYPRSPKMNAFIERFNGIIQDQFVSWHKHDLKDTNYFNQILTDYLIWYNTEKVHRSLNNLSPLQYYVNNYILNTKKSNMCWTGTNI